MPHMYDRDREFNEIHQGSIERGRMLKRPEELPRGTSEVRNYGDLDTCPKCKKSRVQAFKSFCNGCPVCVGEHLHIQCICKYAYAESLGHYAPAEFLQKIPKGFIENTQYAIPPKKKYYHWYLLLFVVIVITFKVIL